MLPELLGVMQRWLTEAILRYHKLLLRSKGEYLEDYVSATEAILALKDELAGAEAFSPAV